MSLEDPLAKPEWCSIDPGIQEAVLNLLVTPSIRGTTATEKIGFNASMEAIEAHIRGEGRVAAVFAARNDLSAVECLPIALACTAGQIRLVTLPTGAQAKLSTGVIAILENSAEMGTLRLVEQVTPPKLDWVYRAAKLKRRK